VIVEARERSGALITADFALEAGREVFAVPGEITSSLSAGTNALLRLGATPLTRVSDVLEPLGLEQARGEAPELGEHARTVLAALEEEPAGADDLGRVTERYLDRLAELAGDAFRRTGSLRLAANAGERAELEAEYEALREDGFAAEWRDELPEPLAGRYHGATFHPPDGSLQPARWVRRLAGLAAAAGAELREGQRIESLDELEADQVVIATDG